jgi:hypothetical protein
VSAPNAAEVAVVTAATLPGSRTANGRSNSASAKLNIAEVAPMPMASEQMEINANPGERGKIRSANLRDFHM